MLHWEWDNAARCFISRQQNVEGFITHNGDLDFYQFVPGGRFYSTDEIMLILEHMLGHRRPSEVDSVAIAGLLDLTRTAGLWGASARLGYLSSGVSPSVDLVEAIEEGQLLGCHALVKVGQVFESEWQKLLKEVAAAQADAKQQPANDVERACAASGDATDAADAVPRLRGEGLAPVFESLRAARAALEERLAERCTVALAAAASSLQLGSLVQQDGALAAVCRTAIGAFFDHSLPTASQLLLACAKGSFGLVLSHSLEAHGRLVIAAQGQPMSVAFYPQMGMVLFASEATATRLALEYDADQPWRRVEIADAAMFNDASAMPSEPPKQPPAPESEHMKAFRLDLDDVRGEVVVLSWTSEMHEQAGTVAMVKSAAGALVSNPIAAGFNKMFSSSTSNESSSSPRKAVASTPAEVEAEKVMEYTMRNGATGEVRAYSSKKANAGPYNKRTTLRSRALRLTEDDNMLHIPPLRLTDTVGEDIADIPPMVNKLRLSFSPSAYVAGSHSNARTAQHLVKLLQERVDRPRKRDDVGIDLLLTGCEVSLWTAEQFAADLRRCFPCLRAQALSANKILGLLGQRVPVQPLGFGIDQSSFINAVRGSVVLIVSHSGGTFAPLACSNLLRPLAGSLFAVTAFYDSHLSRSVRSNSPTPSIAAKHVFSTDTGFRLAEPASISVVATHCLFTHLLTHILATFISVTERTAAEARAAAQAERSASVREGSVAKPSSASYEAEAVHPKLAAELHKLGESHLVDVVEIIGNSENSAYETETGRELRRIGNRWAMHVLEAPISWLLSLLYLIITVMGGVTPTTPFRGDLSTAAAFFAGAIDVAIYLFMPIWTTWIVRIATRRPLLHRLGGRTILVGDVPWVAQSLEAFLSKLFALSYSMTGITVLSGNPADHLVHRHTHRVARGLLLAIGRPDGRVCSLASSDSTVLLSTKQASSIQSMATTCETLCVGHNSAGAPSRWINVALPTTRADFLSQRLLRVPAHGLSPNSVLGRVEHACVQEEALTGAQLSELAGGPLAALKSIHGGSAYAGTAYAGSVHGGSVHGARYGSQYEGRGSALSMAETAAGDACMQLDQPPKPPAPPSAIAASTRTDSARQASQPVGATLVADAFVSAEPSKVEALLERQRLLEVLFENRYASVQRLIAFLVIFHRMGKRVQNFWDTASIGIFSYDMSRTQSMMRIATTASPVSGAEVRERTAELEKL